MGGDYSLPSHHPRAIAPCPPPSSICSLLTASATPSSHSAACAQFLPWWSLRVLSTQQQLLTDPAPALREGILRQGSLLRAALAEHAGLIGEAAIPTLDRSRRAHAYFPEVACSWLLVVPCPENTCAYMLIHLLLHRPLFASGHLEIALSAMLYKEHKRAKVDIPCPLPAR